MEIIHKNCYDHALKVRNNFYLILNAFVDMGYKQTIRYLEGRLLS